VSLSYLATPAYKLCA